jgi:hypothetical protein
LPSSIFGVKISTQNGLDWREFTIRQPVNENDYCRLGGIWMFTVKKAWLIPIVMLLLVAIVIGILPGCGGKKGATTSSANSPFFSQIDGEILRSAYTEYENLKLTSSPDEARKQLLNKLNNKTEGVKKAKLGIDGYTIFIDYKDGDFAAVDTFDEAESASQVKPTGLLPKGNLPADFVAGANNFKFDSKVAGVVKVNYFPKGTGIGGFASRLSAAAIPARTTVSSKKVLILCPLNPDKDATNTTVPYDCQKLLKEYGWTDNDITVKMNTGGDIPGILNVKLEDYRQIGNYGLILFFGHGSAENNKNEDNLFLQSCTMTKAALESNAEYSDWKKNKKLLVIDEFTSSDGKTVLYDLFIRADLLRQILGPLPGSYVQMATCWGWYFSKLFMDQGAAVFLGWDRKVQYTTADENQIEMLSLMLGQTLSVGDAYLDKSVTQVEVSDISPEKLWDPSDLITKTFTGGSEISPRPGATPTGMIYFDSNFYAGSSGDPINYYLPAWINLKIPVLPAGTSRLKVDILDSGKNRYITEDKTVAGDQTSVEINNFGNNCFPPGPCSVAIYAFDSKGASLLSNQAEFKLRPGANLLTISSSKYKYTLSGSPDPKAGISFSRSGGMGLYIKLNGKALVNGEWSGALSFDAQPGDELEIMVIGSSGEIFSPGIFSASLGPLWLTSWISGEQVKITDGGDFKQFIGYDQTVVFDQKFVIPGAKPSPTPTPLTSTVIPTTPTTTTPFTTTPPATTTTTQTTITTTPTATPTTSPASTPLTHVDVWLTATNDSKATHVSSLKAGSVTTLYIWAQGGNGQTGDFTLFGTLQQGTQMQLGGTKHATRGEVIYCGQWNGAFLNTVGSVSVNAISGSATVGSTSINITN